MGALYARSRRRFDPFGEAEAEWIGTRGIGSRCARGGRRPESGPAHLAGDWRRDTIRFDAPRDARGAGRAPWARRRGGSLLGRSRRGRTKTSTVTVFWHESVVEAGDGPSAAPKRERYRASTSRRTPGNRSSRQCRCWRSPPWLRLREARVRRCAAARPRAGRGVSRRTALSDLG